MFAEDALRLIADKTRAQFPTAIRVTCQIVNYESVLSTPSAVSSSSDEMWVKTKNWPELTALTSMFAINRYKWRTCENTVYFAKRRETADTSKGVDAVNTGLGRKAGTYTTIVRTVKESAGCCENLSRACSPCAAAAFTTCPPMRHAPPPRPVPTFPIQTEVTVLTEVGVAPRALGAPSVPLVLRLASLQP